MMAPPPANEAQWLHLFTSTIRELYIADAINLLASPVGAIYQFRYEPKYLDVATRTRWEKGELTGVAVAVYFSLQHPAEYHEAVYIPLRRGEVVRTGVEGEIYTVQFRLNDYIPLQEDSSPTDTSMRASKVKRFTQNLRTILGDNHPDKGVSATVGPSAASFVTASGLPGKDFQAVVRFLAPSLYFSPRTYFRVVEIIKDSDGKVIEISNNGYLHLTAGSDYTLHVSHYQPSSSFDKATIKVESPDSLDIVGRREFLISSRYDVFTLRLFAPFRDSGAVGELSIRVDNASNSPAALVPVVINPSTGHTMSGPFLGAGGALALALPAVLASNAYIPLRVTLASIGAFFVTLGLWLRRQKGLQT